MKFLPKKMTSQNVSLNPALRIFWLVRVRLNYKELIHICRRRIHGSRSLLRLSESVNSISLKSVHKPGRREFNSPRGHLYVYTNVPQHGDSFVARREHGKIRVILVRAEIDYVPTPKGSKENIGLRKRVSVIGITLEGFESQGYLSWAYWSLGPCSAASYRTRCIIYNAHKKNHVGSRVNKDHKEIWGFRNLSIGPYDHSESLVDKITDKYYS